jgi:type IV pilus assembly protein PilM
MVSSRCWVGLDWGASGFKLVEVQAQPSGVALTRFLLKDWPADLDASQREAQLRQALSDFGAREIHIGLGGSELVIRRLVLPGMPLAEMAEAVRWQMKDQVSFPVQDAKLAVEVVGENRKREVSQMEVLVAATSGSTFAERLTAVGQIGLSPSSLVPTAQALWSAAWTLHPDARQGDVALLDLGSTQTHLAIASKGMLRMVRDLAVGSETLSQALIGVVASDSGQTVIDSTMAEALKRRYGVLSADQQGSSEEGIPLQQLASLMRPAFEGMVTEISRFLDFYRVQLNGRGVNRLFLCGGGALIRGLAQHLSEALELPVVCLNPLACESPSQADGPRLAVAFGLAANRGRTLNVMGSDGGGRLLGGWARSAALGLAGLVLLVGLGFGSAALAARWRLRSLQARWESVQPTYARYQQLSREEHQLRSMLDAADALRNGRPLWDGALKELGAVMPSAVRLTSLHAERILQDIGSPIQVGIKGEVAATSTQPQAELVALVDSLESSVFFKDVRLDRSERSADVAEPLRFELTCRLQ